MLPESNPSAAMEPASSADDGAVSSTEPAGPSVGQTGFRNLVLELVLDFCNETTLLALAETCKDTARFLDGKWDQIADTSLLVDDFMDVRYEDLKLPPPGFRNIRSFLTMLVRKICPFCKKWVPESNDWRVCRCEHTMDSIKLSVRDMRKHCPKHLLKLVPYSTQSNIWSRGWRQEISRKWVYTVYDLRWLVRDHPEMASLVASRTAKKRKREQALDDKRKRAVRRFSRKLGKSCPEWIDRHPVFDEVRRGNLGAVKDQDKILARLRLSVDREGELQNSKRWHPATWRVVSRTRFIMTEKQAHPDDVSRALKTMGVEQDPVSPYLLTKLGKLASAHPTAKSSDFRLMIMRTKEERLTWMLSLGHFKEPIAKMLGKRLRKIASCPAKSLDLFSDLVHREQLKMRRLEDLKALFELSTSPSAGIAWPQVRDHFVAQDWIEHTFQSTRTADEILAEVLERFELSRQWTQTPRLEKMRMPQELDSIRDYLKRSRHIDETGQLASCMSSHCSLPESLACKNGCCGSCCIDCDPSNDYDY